MEKGPTERSALVAPKDPASSKEHPRWRIYVVFLAPAFAGFLYGYSIGAISGSVESVASANGGLSAFSNSALTVSEVTGALIASIAAFYGGEIIGRRRELILGSCFYLLGTIVTELSAEYGVVYTGRLIYGLGIGFSMHSAPLYIAEIAPSNVHTLHNPHHAHPLPMLTRGTCDVGRCAALSSRSRKPSSSSAC